MVFEKIEINNFYFLGLVVHFTLFQTSLRDQENLKNYWKYSPFSKKMHIDKKSESWKRLTAKMIFDSTVICLARCLSRQIRRVVNQNTPNGGSTGSGWDVEGAEGSQIIICDHIPVLST